MTKMEEVILDRIVLRSTNGKFRFRLEVTDNGELIATPLVSRPGDPSTWNLGTAGRCLCPNTLEQS
jgi:hypothetical protein